MARVRRLRRRGCIEGDMPPPAASRGRFCSETCYFCEMQTFWPDDHHAACEVEALENTVVCRQLVLQIPQLCSVFKQIVVFLVEPDCSIETRRLLFLAHTLLAEGSIFRQCSFYYNCWRAELKNKTDSHEEDIFDRILSYLQKESYVVEGVFWLVEH